MPDHQIRYDLLVQEALRSVVRRVLGDAARDGLPGEHFFNISFRTKDPGVAIPSSLTARYPEEMAIILQHEFWDLSVSEDHFQVSLNFSRRPERLTIPFTAITGFSDPSVPFGFKLEAQNGQTAKEPQFTTAAPPPKAVPAPIRPVEAKPAAKIDKKPVLTPVKAVENAPAPAPGDGQKSKVVSIDAFRKK